MTALEQHLQAELEKLKQEKKIMQQIATANGFYQYYFSQLLNYKSNLDCFNAVNEMYYEFFGEYRYSGYESFKQQIKKYSKQ